MHTAITQSSTFLSAIQTDADTARAIARKIFEAYDKDRSSAIENYEISPLLQDVYRSMNKSFSPSQSDVDGYSKVLDRNGDGRVTLQDIENLCIKYLVSDTNLSKSQVSYSTTPAGYLHEAGESVKKSGYGGYGLDHYATSGLGTSAAPRTYELSTSGYGQTGEYAKKAGNLANSGHHGTGDVTSSYLSNSGAGFNATGSQTFGTQNAGAQNSGSSFRLLKKSQLEDIRKIFVRFDADQSGFIDEKELRLLMEETYKILAVNRTISNDDVSSYLKLVDTNRDGKISLEEYQQIVIKALERIGIYFE